MNGAAAFIPSTSNGRPDIFVRSSMNSLGIWSPTAPTITATLVWNHLPSVQAATMRDNPSWPGRLSAGIWNRFSSSTSIIEVSQKISAPICRTGVRRYPPVSGVRSGLGMIDGMSTAAQPRFFIRKASLIFSENGERSNWCRIMLCAFAILMPPQTDLDLSLRDFPAKGRDDQSFASACSKSAIISAASSIPTDRRTVSGAAPAAVFCSSES